MSTPAQQSANQANAQKSSGPITNEGKARSAVNSRVHGLCAKDILIGPEEQADFDGVAQQLDFDLNPRGAVERTLFKEIVAAAWQLDRVRRMETEACAGKTSYSDILDDDLLQKKLDRLARHHTRIERTFHRCLKTLKALQAERPKHECFPHYDLDALLSADADHSGAISERSQPEFIETGLGFNRSEAELVERQRRIQTKAA